MKKKGRIIWDEKPLCEACGEEEADSFSHYGAGGPPDWAFVGACQDNATAYHVTFERFFSSPASTVDWLAHLHAKGWGWNGFMDMMARFRAATGAVEN